MKMNVNSSLKRLNLDSKYNSNNITELTNTELKKAYHIMALNYHPDKNNDPKSKEIFQEIGDAYSLLYNIINSNIYNIYENNTEEELYDTPYTDLMINFLKILLKSHDSGEIHKFQKKCIIYSTKLFDQLFDKININVLEDIYKFIVINSLNLSEETIEILKDIINSKLKLYNRYIINPSLENVFNCEIFKLEIDNDIVYVPLWHQEMLYENIIIKIQPILPPHITIDEYNNIHIKYNNKLQNIIDLIDKDINTIEVDNYKIPIEELKFKKNQTYLFKNQGIPVINSFDILDNKNKANVLIHITLE
jgi:curved DNA-binding protein CbpA